MGVSATVWDRGLGRRVAAAAGFGSGTSRSLGSEVCRKSGVVEEGSFGVVIPDSIALASPEAERDGRV